jgi:hypothetical protein
LSNIEQTQTRIGVRLGSGIYLRRAWSIHTTLDDEGWRLLAILQASRAQEIAAADLISHPTRSVLYPARMNMLADLADLQVKRATAAAVYREHCKAMRKK